MKPERESSPIQCFVDPLKQQSENSLHIMDYSHSLDQVPDSEHLLINSSQDTSIESYSNDNISSCTDITEQQTSLKDQAQLYNSSQEPSNSYYGATSPNIPNTHYSNTVDTSQFDFQQNLTNFQQNMSHLQHFTSQVRNSSSDGDSFLQNQYLERLQELVPWIPKDEELPKLQLVQAVIDYINILQEQLATGSPTPISDSTSTEFDELRSPFLSVVDSPMTSDVKSGISICGDSSPLTPSTPPAVVHSHLLNHLQDNQQMVNELRQLQLVQRLTAGEEVGKQQMVRQFIHQHQIIDDLRHMNLKDSTSVRQHMVNNVGGGSTSSSDGDSEGGGGKKTSTGHPDDGNCLPQLTATAAASVEHVINDLESSVIHHHHQLGLSSLLATGGVTAVDTQSNHRQQLPPYSQAQLYNSDLIIEKPIAPFFPAPPSPQTIKAARRKKLQHKKLQEQLQQQQLLHHHQQQLANNCAYGVTES